MIEADKGALTEFLKQRQPAMPVNTVPGMPPQPLAPPSTFPDLKPPTNFLSDINTLLTNVNQLLSNPVVEKFIGGGVERKAQTLEAQRSYLPQHMQQASPPEAPPTSPPVVHPTTDAKTSGGAPSQEPPRQPQQEAPTEEQKKEALAKVYDFIIAIVGGAVEAKPDVTGKEMLDVLKQPASFDAFVKKFGEKI